MSRKEVIIITGASGFLGTWLADEAHKAGYSLIGIDLRAPFRPQIWTHFATSSLETVDLVQLLQNQSIHAVFHLAGSASVGSSVTDPYGDFYSLLPGTSRLALHIVKFHPQARLFLFSSAAVYGNPQQLPITEQSPIAPISPYGVHKATAETLLAHYSDIFGLKVNIFRLFSIYGPGLRKQLVWDVCQRAITALADNQKSITLFGTGQESRDFLYVKDLCRAVLKVLQQPSERNFELYNLASGTESTIAEVASCLIQNISPQLSILFNGVVPKGDPTNWRTDVSKLQDVGFQPQYTLKQGLEEVVTWANSRGE